MIKFKKLFCLLIIFISCTQAHSGVTPVSLGLLPPVQFPPEKFTIVGARISALYGQHQEVYGIDIGALGNITTQNFVGLAVAGGFNHTKNMATVLGLQAAGGANINTGKLKVFGLQAALGANINTGEARIFGLQFAAANLASHTKIYGVQAGLYNVAQEVYGFQIGLVNKTEYLHGLQIGLLNIYSKGTVGVSPILNIGF